MALFLREETSEAETAAFRLHAIGDDMVQAVVVDWCPGDATRYQLALIERLGGVRHLVLLNLGGRVFELPPFRVDVEGWIAAGIPPGSWPGLRPLLAALGAAPGPAEYRPTSRYRNGDEVPEGWQGRHDVELEGDARRGWM